MANEIDRDAVATEVQNLKADLVRFVLTDVRDNPGQPGTPALNAEIAALVEGAVRKTLTDPNGEVARLKAEIASATAQVQQLRAGLESTTAAALSAAHPPKGNMTRLKMDAIGKPDTQVGTNLDGSSTDFQNTPPPINRDDRAKGLGKWTLPAGAGLVAGVLATLGAQYLTPSAPATPAPEELTTEQRIDNSASGYGDALGALAPALNAAGLGPDAPESVASSAIDAAKREDLMALLGEAAVEAETLKRALQPTVHGGGGRSITELATQADQLRAQARRLQDAAEPMEPKKLAELIEQCQGTARRLQSTDNG